MHSRGAGHRCQVHASVHHSLWDRMEGRLAIQKGHSHAVPFCCKCAGGCMAWGPMGEGKRVNTWCAHAMATRIHRSCMHPHASQWVQGVSAIGGCLMLCMRGQWMLAVPCGGLVCSGARGEVSWPVPPCAYNPTLHKEAHPHIQDKCRCVGPWTSFFVKSDTSLAVSFFTKNEVHGPRAWHRANGSAALRARRCKTATKRCRRPLTPRLPPESTQLKPDPEWIPRELTVHKQPSLY